MPRSTSRRAEPRQIGTRGSSRDAAAQEGEALLSRLLDPLLSHLEPACLRALRQACKSVRSQVDSSIRSLTARRPALIKDIKAAGRHWPHVEGLVFPQGMLSGLQPANALAAAATAFPMLRHIDMVRSCHASSH